jgi:hypothetical protein
VGRPGPSTRDPLWTVDEAAAYFAEGGVPIEARRLKGIIRALGWTPAGYTPSGEQGGRGKAMYLISDLMRLHAAIAPFIAAQGPKSGYNPETGGPT